MQCEILLFLTLPDLYKIFILYNSHYTFILLFLALTSHFFPKPKITDLKVFYIPKYNFNFFNEDFLDISKISSNYSSESKSDFSYSSPVATEPYIPICANELGHTFFAFSITASIIFLFTLFIITSLLAIISKLIYFKLFCFYASVSSIKILYC